MVKGVVTINENEVAGMMRLQQQFERKLRLPVVVSQSGTAYVLDASCGQVEVLASDTASPALNRVKIPARRRRAVALKMFWRYPEVPVSTAQAILEKISDGESKPQSIHIIIDTGATVADWPVLTQVISAVSNIPAKAKIPTKITIDGIFTCPDERQTDWLIKQKIVVRYILGPALGYAGDLDAATAKTIEEMANQGLRIPLLFYWSGQSGSVTAEMLSKALRLNKLAGIGILPYFLSPRFDRTTPAISCDSNGFSEVVSFLYTDRFLNEYLEEPVSDIEGHLAGAPGVRSVGILMTKDATLFPFRRFPFAANHKNTTKKLLLYQRCRKCVWRQVCGGIDASPSGYRKQYKIAANAWCAYRKSFMRRIVGECLDIREHLHKIEGRLMKEDKV
jgi:hypothetical protein